jgi:MFS family permease
MISISRAEGKLFYGWVVVAAGLLIGLISLGIRHSFGVFFSSIESQFFLSRVSTSAIFSIYMVLCGIFSIIGGWALDKYGPRRVSMIMGLFAGLSLLLTSQVNASWQLFVSYSLLLALGTGAVFTVVNSTVSRWFDRRRGLALGIVGAGEPFGTIVVAPFSSYLIISFGWTTAFTVLGLSAWFVIGFASMLLRKEPASIGLAPEIKATLLEQPIQQSGYLLSEACRTSKFWFFGLMWLLLSANVHIILTHVVPHAIDSGISPMNAAFIISLVGIASLLGRIAGGKISDITGRRTPAIVSSLIQFGALIWMVWVHELWMFYLFAVIFGLSWGGFGIQVTASISDVFGLRCLGAIMGALVIGWTMGAAIGPAIGGFIYDTFNNYSLAFLTGAVGILAAAILSTQIKKTRDTDYIR